MTTNSGSELMMKSTPLGQFVCPRFVLRGGEVDEHTVTRDAEDGNAYTCACGEQFLWDDEVHWERVEEEEEE